MPSTGPFGGYSAAFGSRKVVVVVRPRRNKTFDGIAYVKHGTNGTGDECPETITGLPYAAAKVFAARRSTSRRLEAVRVRGLSR